MKYIVISDLHGALSSADKLNDLANLYPEAKILALGDFLYHGPRNDLPNDYDPKKVIPILNNFKDRIIAIRGNCDAEVDQMVLNFKIMDEYQILDLNNHKLFITHGHHHNFDDLPRLNHQDIFLQGHSHIPVAKKENDIYLLNPGSISLPKENHPRTYGILDDQGFIIYTIDDQNYLEIKFN